MQPERNRIERRQLKHCQPTLVNTVISCSLSLFLSEAASPGRDIQSRGTVGPGCRLQRICSAHAHPYPTESHQSPHARPGLHASADMCDLPSPRNHFESMTCITVGSGELTTHCWSVRLSTVNRDEREDIVDFSSPCRETMRKLEFLKLFAFFHLRAWIYLFLSACIFCLFVSYCIVVVLL